MTPELATKPDDALLRDTQPIPGRCGAKLKNPLASRAARAARAAAVAEGQDPADVRRAVKAAIREAQARASDDDPVTYCQNPPVVGSRRCNLHGGKTPRGIDHPRTQLGHKYQRYRGVDLPAKLAERYLRSMQDPELTSLNQELGLLDSRVGQLVEQFPTQESAASWAKVTETTRALGADLDDLVDLADPELTAESRTQLLETLRARLTEHVRALERGVGQAAAERSIWSEVLESFELRRRLVDTERRREEALQVSLTMRQGVALVGAIVAAIGEEITDAQLRLRLAGRIRGLLSRPEVERPGITDLAHADPKRALHATVDGK